MKKDWTYKKFEDCIENVKYTKKIQSKDYMASGEYPIISQEEELVSGYWNKNEDVFFAPRPLVVFGDHTRVLKYIDFDFVLGADGVKILLPIEDLEAKFLYYFLKWYNVPNLGYSRHYKLLKEISIPVPPLSIQRSIVAELDLLHSVISKKKEQLCALDNLAQSLFFQMFGDPITNPMGWEVKKLGEVCDDLFAGGDVPKNDFSEEKNDVQNVPIYANGIKNEGLYGYTSKPRVLSPAVTISGRGTIGASFIRTVPFLPIIRLIVAIPSKKVNLVYFAESIKLLNFEGNGISIPQLTIPKVKEYKILLPPLSLQQSFAAKVSAIEAQKQAVQQSIREVEALLAERMDNYFS